MSIFDNKVPYERKFKLELTITPGYIVDNDSWIPYKNAEFDYSALQVAISYDNHILVQQNLNADPITVVKQLADNVGQHALTIILSGKTDSHTQMIDGVDATAVMHVKLRIEDLNLNLALAEKLVYQTESGDRLFWSELMGVNGTQTIPIHTPIYPWLFEHETELVSQIFQVLKN